MKKISNRLKKGGIADIITLMVIVGLVVALIIAVVLPMVEQAQNAGSDASSDIDTINGKISEIRGAGGGDDGAGEEDW